MENIENKIRYLEMIQGIINRMASNSFMLKGWTLTLITCAFALTGNDTSWIYFVIISLPIIIFWAMDAFYLQKERLYRSLYDKARNMEEIDFSLSASIDEFNEAKNRFICCFCSKTEFPFYIILVAVCAVIKIVIPTFFVIS